MNEEKFIQDVFSKMENFKEQFLKSTLSELPYVSLILTVLGLVRSPEEVIQGLN